MSLIHEVMFRSMLVEMEKIAEARMEKRALLGEVKSVTKVIKGAKPPPIPAAARLPRAPLPPARPTAGPLSQPASTLVGPGGPVSLPPVGPTAVNPAGTAAKRTHGFRGNRGRAGEVVLRPPPTQHGAFTTAPRPAGRVAPAPTAPAPATVAPTAAPAVAPAVTPATPPAAGQTWQSIRETGQQVGQRAREIGGQVWANPYGRGATLVGGGLLAGAGLHSLGSNRTY